MKAFFKHLCPFYRSYHKLAYTNQKISYFDYLKYRLLGSNTYWHKHKTCYVGMPKRLFIGKNSSVLREYNFLQCSGGVYIGKYVEFATRVSLLSANHDLYDQRKSIKEPIVIGDYCWLGMNSSILAGVKLGPRTIVANGAVVTKSYPEGMCVLAGVPAKPIKFLDKEKFIPWTYQEEYYGFLSAEDFENNPQYIVDKYLDKNCFSIKNGEIVLNQPK